MTSRSRAHAPEPDPELTALTALYARHAPDLPGSPDDQLPILEEAARGHLRLAGHRAPGEPLVRVCDTQDGRLVEIVTDDMPFLVGALLAGIARAGGEVKRVLHPIVVVRRSADGKLAETLTAADPAAPPVDTLAESWIQLLLAPSATPVAQIERELAAVLEAVREVVEDSEPMARRAEALAAELPGSPVALDGTHASDVASLLRWLADGHFTFLGYRHYTVEGTGLRAEPDTGLGVLRRGSEIASSFAPQVDRVDDAERTSDAPHDLLVMTRANAPSPLKPVHPYYLAIGTVDAEGRLAGEHRFLGTLTVPALYESVLDIPVVERRVRDAIHRAGFPLDSYSGQQMLEVISGLPREELFSASEQRLHDTAVGVLAVGAHRSVRLFLRPDPYRRFLSCLVYLPRDRYTTSSRLAMADLLQRRLGGTSVDYTARVTESQLALVHFTVHTPVDAAGYAGVDVPALQDELTGAIRTWDDRLLSATGSVALVAQVPGVPEEYKAVVDPEQAVEDLRRIVALGDPGDFAVRTRASQDGAADRRFTLYLSGAPATLTSVLPVLQQLGVDVLDERPSEFVRADGLRVYVYDFGLRLDEATSSAVYARQEADVEAGFCSAFSAAWRGDAETDRFSALVLRAGLPWREVAVLRAYARYARQLGSPYGVQYMAETLLGQPDVARGLLALFRARFEPGVADRETAMEAALQDLRSRIDAVTGLDADRILRGYLAMITATLRTNWFRERSFFSFKLDPSQVPDMPAPKPKFEIFVYSPRVEGVHLRFGAVARGGLRWSDRPQDFRTEILGLVKAQAVKNAVIVPVGAKGGFFVRAAQPDPAEVEACYRMFISGLLDVTDNLANIDGVGVTVPPENVVRHDGDDSYLVVAADKGTAKFSDTANDVAASYGFWLGDAFASGGSVGYDHKAMGITAKGAWESVKRHFRELGVDTQTEEFTVVGVGDMSGDVFGNGMLLSKHIRLVVAFDHRHVFIDPNPDAARSFAERERMFKLPGSSWDDYDKSLISAGGGVWPRSAKSIPVSPEARVVLGLKPEVTQLAPNELLNAALKAPVDLLWNGGIGTYVKASSETHADARDRANNGLRVDGGELRCRIVGEGGNLGMTQKGRIEAAHKGVLLNTDFIDNSAGVDTSDHEVNIKILLNDAVQRGELGEADRNKQLAAMTDEVAQLVLWDNYRQNQAITLMEHQSVKRIGSMAHFIRTLEAEGQLDRQVENLPSEAELTERKTRNQGLTRPELAVLLSYDKIRLFQQLLDSDVPEDPYLSKELVRYFPAPLHEKYAEHMQRHRLKREIIATAVTNSTINRMGATFMMRMQEDTGKGPAAIAKAYTAAREILDARELWAEIEALDSKVAEGTQVDAVMQIWSLLRHMTRWLLNRPGGTLEIAANVERYQADVSALRRALPEVLTTTGKADFASSQEKWEGLGLPAELAVRLARLSELRAALDMVEVAQQAGQPVEKVAGVFYELGEALDLEWLRGQIEALPVEGHWHAQARGSLLDELNHQHRALAQQVLKLDGGGKDVSPVQAWLRRDDATLQHTRGMLAEILTQNADYPIASVAVRRLAQLAQVPVG